MSFRGGFNSFSLNSIELNSEGTDAPVVGGGGLTLNLIADPAKFGLSATDPTFGSQGLTLDPAPGRFGLAVSTPSVTLGTLTLSPGSGSFGLSATDPTFGSQGLTLDPAPAEFGFSASYVSGIHIIGLQASFGLKILAYDVLYRIVLPVPPQNKVALGFSTTAPVVTKSTITVVPYPAKMGFKISGTTVLGTAVFDFASSSPKFGMKTGSLSLVQGTVHVSPTQAKFGEKLLIPIVLFGSLNASGSVRFGAKAQSASVTLSTVTVTPAAAYLGFHTGVSSVRRGSVSLTLTPVEIGFSATDATVSVNTLVHLHVYPDPAAYSLRVTEPVVQTTTLNIDLDSDLTGSPSFDITAANPPATMATLTLDVTSRPGKYGMSVTFNKALMLSKLYSGERVWGLYRIKAGPAAGTQMVSASDIGGLHTHDVKYARRLTKQLRDLMERQLIQIHRLRNLDLQQSAGLQTSGSNGLVLGVVTDFSSLNQAVKNIAEAQNAMVLDIMNLRALYIEVRNNLESVADQAQTKGHQIYNVVSQTGLDVMARRYLDVRARPKSITFAYNDPNGSSDPNGDEI